MIGIAGTVFSPSRGESRFAMPRTRALALGPLNLNLKWRTSESPVSQLGQARPGARGDNGQSRALSLRVCQCTVTPKR
jgi:hypothetical protein